MDGQTENRLMIVVILRLCFAARVNKQFLFIADDIIIIATFSCVAIGLVLLLLL